MNKQEFEAASAKIVAAYAKHPNIARVIESKSAGNLRNYEDICTAAAENCCDYPNDDQEFLDMFESSLEGILSHTGR